jgi:hypothetical protein
MAYSRQYIPGDRLVVCDICGFEYRFSQMRKGVMGNQKGLNIGPDCWDNIHPRETKPKTRKEGVLPEIK